MTLEKFPDDSINFDFDCTNILGPAETITGVVSVAQAPTFPALDPALLAFGTPIVNLTAISYPDGRTMAIGKGIQVRIGGGTADTATAPRAYRVNIEFSTSDGNTLTTSAPLWVLAPWTTQSSC